MPRLQGCANLKTRLCMPYTVPTTDLAADRVVVDQHLTELFYSLAKRDTGGVAEAMRYAVLGPGQRIRPIVAMRVARLVDAPDACVIRAAGAVELLHCASLIVDDLPCMDDEALRRDRATVHVAFGEATAVLAAFALVALAARSVVDVEAPPSLLSRLLHFQMDLLHTLDCASLIAGQALDLRLAGALREQQRESVTQLKTVPLFQLAVKAGTLLSDLSPEQACALQDFGRLFGTAFQMADDYLDNECASILPLESQLDQTRRSIRVFGSRARELEGLLDYLHARAWQKDHRHR